MQGISVICIVILSFWSQSTIKFSLFILYQALSPPVHFPSYGKLTQCPFAPYLSASRYCSLLILWQTDAVPAQDAHTLAGESWLARSTNGLHGCLQNVLMEQVDGSAWLVRLQHGFADGVMLADADLVDAARLLAFTVFCQITEGSRRSSLHPLLTDAVLALRTRTALSVQVTMVSGRATLEAVCAVAVLIWLALLCHAAMTHNHVVVISVFMTVPSAGVRLLLRRCCWKVSSVSCCRWRIGDGRHRRAI